MKRILLGTPVRDSATLPYLFGLWDAAKSISGCELVPAISKATYVNCARNDLVEKARAERCSELVFIDADVGWDALKLLRLLSHDVEIVGGIYAKRKSGEPEWVAHAEEGSKPDENGLQACNDLPAGFLRVKMSVFDRMDEVFRGRRFKHGSENPRTEYFPIGLAEKNGWRHPAEAKLEAIASILSHFPASDRPTALRDEILAIIERNSLPELIGEDISWCRMAKHAGFTLWADTKLALRHHGDIGYPAKEISI